MTPTCTPRFLDRYDPYTPNIAAFLQPEVLMPLADKERGPTPASPASTAWLLDASPRLPSPVSASVLLLGPCGSRRHRPPQDAHSRVQPATRTALFLPSTSARLPAKFDVFA
ncbi:hypothetical protein D9619_011423 [Psilocybe cf. subviscida]|uniref:Uncharacterized protein n=1 Tax=Psilocybe cf. subviscida TaxID=2480587 RepID=A0A8H5BJJ9_9AGAR|nr:hypothetical protein D9619_011423 [Psilocybe cf. subviscida]